jgi:hypothetical protein
MLWSNNSAMNKDSFHIRFEYSRPPKQVIHESSMVTHMCSRKLATWTVLERLQQEIFRCASLFPSL